MHWPWQIYVTCTLKKLILPIFWHGQQCVANGQEWKLTKWKDGPIYSKLGPCLVHPKNQKVFKILCHIESCGTCMKH